MHGFGWRGQLGYIAPSTLERQGPEWYRVVPAGCALITTTLRIAALNEENITRSLGLMDEAVDHLVGTGAEAIYLGGIPPFRWGGAPLVQDVMGRIEQRSGLAAGTDLTALVEGLETLGARSVALISPFEAHLDEFIASYLGDKGIRVHRVPGLGIPRNVDIARLPFAMPHQMARQHREIVEAADAIFIACGRFGSIDGIAAMETDFRRPVITANQAMVWWGLRALQVREPICGFGRLLETLA